jgi:thymidylate synthase (FAD)
MKQVEPKVFFLGEDKMNHAGVEAWLTAVGGDEALQILDQMTGSDTEQLIELYARRCYKSFAPDLNPNVTKITKDSAAYHQNIARQRHGSVVAHGQCHFAFEGVSRVFTHELVRNRVGTEFSQESLRYVRLTDIPMWIPPIIAEEKEKRQLPPPYWRMVEYPFIGNPEEIFSIGVETLEWCQRALAAYYNIDHIKSFDRKKKLTSAFRRIAPIGLATGIGVTFNIRALRWIIEQRTHRSAEEEIRLVFGKVAEVAKEKWPMLFFDFQVEKVDGLPEWVPTNSKI